MHWHICSDLVHRVDSELLTRIPGRTNVPAGERCLAWLLCAQPSTGQSEPCPLRWILSAPRSLAVTIGVFLQESPVPRHDCLMARGLASRSSGGEIRFRRLSSVGGNGSSGVGKEIVTSVALKIGNKLRRARTPSFPAGWSWCCGRKRGSGCEQSPPGPPQSWSATW